MMKTKTPTIDEAIGARIRELRGDTPHEIVAVIARRAGLNWSRSQLAMIEGGRRRLQLGEWFVLPMVLTEALARQDDPVTYLDLIPQGADAIELTRGLIARYDLLPDLVKAFGDIRKAKPQAANPEIDHFDRPPIKEKAYQADVAWHAARKFKVTVQAINEAAHKLWGHGLSEERDRQLNQAVNQSPRTIQALRGHVTRQLFTDLQGKLVKLGYLKEKGGKRTKRAKGD